MRDLRELALAEILPGSISGDRQVDAGARALDPELRRVTIDTREALILSRLDELPEPVIDLLAWQYHVDFYEPEALPLERKRALVRGSIAWHRRKGTLWAVRRILSDLGLDDVRIREWWQLGSDPHTFAIEARWRGDQDRVTTFLGPDTNRLLWRAVEATKPVRSWLAYLVVVPVPEEDPDPDHICRWDVCHWSHGRLKEWSLRVDGADLGSDPSTDVGTTRSLFDTARYERAPRWDVGRWGHVVPCGQWVGIHRHISVLTEREPVEPVVHVAAFAKALAVWGWSAWDDMSAFAPRARVVPDAGTWDRDSWSGRRIEGARYEPVLEYAVIREGFASVRDGGDPVWHDGPVPGIAEVLDAGAVLDGDVEVGFLRTGASVAHRFDGRRTWLSGRWSDGGSWDSVDESRCFAEVVLNVEEEWP
jgi:phage tail P2-like protein